jgi:hypothetical protein
MSVLAGFYCGSVVGFLMGLLWRTFVSSSEDMPHSRR